ncbi:UNVERIFIED_ORG: hypothetical protein ABIB19_001667 [Arthrobacter sp. UYEF10]
MAIEDRPGTLFEDVKTLVGPERPDANVCCSLRRPDTSRQSVRMRDLLAQPALHQGFFRQLLGQSLSMNHKASSIASMVISPAKR